MSLRDEVGPDGEKTKVIASRLMKLHEQRRVQGTVNNLVITRLHEVDGR